MEIGGHFIKRKVMLIPTRNVEPTECVVELDVDLDRAMFNMGHTAWRNKSKKSRFGYCTVTVRPVADPAILSNREETEK